MLSIGFVGFGEAASEISRGLSENENVRVYAHDVLLSDRARRPVLQEKANACKVTLCDSIAELAKNVEVVFSTVPCAVAYQAATQVIPHLRPDQIFVDLNAITPAVAEKIAAAVQKTGALFVDGAMMGSLKAKKHKVPTLVSGNGVDALLQRISPLGMDYESVGPQPGVASGNKLTRSLFTKGLAALLIETLICAKKLDSYDVVYESMVKTLKADPTDLIDRLVSGTMLHLERRLEELSGSRQMLQDAGIESKMIEAIIGVFRKIEEADFDRKAVADQARPILEKLSATF